jgi:hypothetical protein
MGLVCSPDPGSVLSARHLAIVVLVGNSVVPLGLFLLGSISGWGFIVSVLSLLSSAQVLSLHNNDGTLKF